MKKPAAHCGGGGTVQTKTYPRQYSQRRHFPQDSSRPCAPDVLPNWQHIGTVVDRLIADLTPEST